MKLIYIIVALFLVTVTDTAIANEKPSKESPPINSFDYSGWTFALGYSSLEKENARNEFIGTNATFFKMGWEGQTNNFAYGAGIDGYLLKDNDSFEVIVEDVFGDRSRESSSANAFGFYGEVGMSYSFGTNNKIDLMGGVDLLWAERSISNCSDCPSEDINLDGGFYVEPRIRMMSDNHFIFTLGYRQYVSGDIDGGFSLGFTWAH
jgi:hypothetical protein